MRKTALAIALLASVGAMLSAGCTATRLKAEAQLPPPLIDKLPIRIGIHYPPEFRDFVHKETRGTIDYEVTLGPAHVTNLDWLLKAMFAEVVPVDDPTHVGMITPPLVFVLEPKFEEYSFLTPKDVAGEAFIVTIRYLLTLYDGNGARVDSFTYTGYGRERARTLASKEPLQVATQRAMRDAGAKVAVELADQESVRLLVRNTGHPMGAPPASAAPPGTEPVQITPRIPSPSAPSTKPPPETEAPAPQSPAETPAQEPPTTSPPAQESPAPSPPAEGEAPAQPPPGEESPSEEESSPVEEPPPAPQVGQDILSGGEASSPSAAGV